MRNQDQTLNNSNFLTPADSETAAGLMDGHMEGRTDGPADDF